jgi:hypothetical protein
MKAIESVKLFVLSVLLPALVLGGGSCVYILYIATYNREYMVEFACLGHEGQCCVPCFLLEAPIYFAVSCFLSWPLGFRHTA